MNELIWWWPALTWYAGFILLAVAAWPWVARAFSCLPGRGLGMFFPGGILFFFVMAQILWRLPFPPIHPAWLWAAVWVAGILGWWRLTPKPVFSKEERRHAAWGGMVFSLSFLFWVVLRAADPAANHTEQPMDVMWVQSAMVSDAPPLRDAWFGGEPHTYYAEGHQKIAFLARLFGTSLPLAVNLGQITFFALTTSLVWLAGSFLADPWRRSAHPLGGFLSAALFWSSNPPGFRDAIDPEPGWWWWESTRVLFDGDIPMITEFPFFSFWLGDNHAHMLGIPGLLLSVIASTQLLRAPRVRCAHALPAALALVWGWRTNAWQAPTALALPLLALAGRFRLHGRVSLSRHALVGFILPLLLVFPLKSGGLFQGIHPNTFGIRPPWELLLVFGFFVPGLLFLVFRSLVCSRSPRFAAWMVVLCFGMLATCEVVFVGDVFMSRMNTVFKVYYQVWILFALVSAAGWSVMLGARGLSRLVGVVTLVLPLAGLLYPLRLSLPALAAPTKSLDAMSVEHPSKRELVLSAADRIPAGDRVAEFPGVSFNPHTSVLGTWTPGKTLLGWTGHMEQWRPGATFPELIFLYTASSPRRLEAELDHLNVQWVLAGPLEQSHYQMTPEWHAWMRWRFDIAFVDGDTVLYGPRK